MGGTIQAIAPAASFLLGLATGLIVPGAPSAGATLAPFLLAVLLFLVGAGLDPAGYRGCLLLGALMGASTVAASAVGGALAGLILGVDPRLAAAAGAGSGWYSMAGPLLASRAGPWWGLVGSSANMIREILSIIMYPLLPGSLRAPGVALGGATTMDTGLPVIAASGGMRVAGLAVAHGLAATLLAPGAAALLAG